MQHYRPRSVGLFKTGLVHKPTSCRPLINSAKNIGVPCCTQMSAATVLQWRLFGIFPYLVAFVALQNIKKKLKFPHPWFLTKKQQTAKKTMFYCARQYVQFDKKRVIIKLGNCQVEIRDSFAGSRRMRLNRADFGFRNAVMTEKKALRHNCSPNIPKWPHQLPPPDPQWAGSLHCILPMRYSARGRHHLCRLTA